MASASFWSLRKSNADAPGSLEGREYPSSPILVVVVFALEADRSDHDLSLADDSKQGYVSRSPEWNDQFALKPVSVGDAASERIRLQNSKLCADGCYCTAR